MRLTFALCALALSGLGCQDNTTGDPNAAVEIEALHSSFEDLPILLAHLLDKDILGEHAELARVTLYNPSSRARRVRVEVVIEGYGLPKDFFVDLKAGARVDQGLTPVLDLDKLYKIQSEVMGDLRVRLYEEDTLIDVAHQSTRLLPVNFVPWRWQGLDMRAAVVGLSTPYDQEGSVEALLGEAADLTEGVGLHGYQENNRAHVEEQIVAIYEALRARGISYVDIPGNFFNQAQYVKRPAQSLASQSANCIDGALIFTSALEALGMEPVIIFVPNHAMPGVRVAPGSEDIIPIETVILDKGTAAEAMARALQTWGDHLLSPELLILDITAARRAGITPVNL
ncbi:hypothetical protein KKB55_01285 [Myxococcota bacterium]|nr:hypothetical protein [Myxococcota bacterium]MBU1896386.1 hypothetical protein [Myxococcota bacterium]